MRQLVSQNAKFSGQVGHNIPLFKTGLSPKLKVVKNKKAVQFCEVFAKLHRLLNKIIKLLT
ncbi:hypothetical protein HMPREF1052_1478 [Pasteurella bettyae CCUG 2042]|uniref:Uncharacterized protein n=1 Tax=Pasteurella bettyae CCUG 2042 TaxID=1095749 RepID=I3DFE5_9PAST|nr:hypothetical protein HMPREF1052_1478 [Pasteurella bettyae CCUG 2042]